MPTVFDCAGGLDCDIAADMPMSACTTFRIGGKADALITVRDGQTLAVLLSRLKESDIPAVLIGGGSNLLVADEGIRGAVIRFDSRHAAIDRIGECSLRCGAGVPLPRLSRAAQQYGLTGLEFACGIPGSAGGGLYMNAGAYGGEMAQVVSEAEILYPSGEIKTVSAADLSLSYRHSALMETGGVVLSLTLSLAQGDGQKIGDKMAELLAARRDKQPLEYPSAGSFFKRPAGYFAGKLIDDCGLRGYRIQDAQVSEKHAGFVINRKEATCDQVKQLEREVRRRVYEQFGVTMQPEVRLIGDRWLP
ncbi:MAG: UDP-N-acetylmuramate dehydrogenase [Acutalibacteraceae bacterium]